MTANQSLHFNSFPPFGHFQLSDLSPAFEAMLAANEALYERLASAESVVWEEFAGPIEDAQARLGNIWSVVSHYNAVLNGEEIKQIYNTLLEKFTRHQTDFLQNQALFERYSSYADSADFERATEDQKASISHRLRDFRLGGIALPPEEKALFAELSSELSRLKNKFAQNVLEATQNWHLHVEDSERLKGVPESAMKQFSRAAEEKGYAGGYLLTLDVPAYLPVLTYCENRELRKELYDAYMTRASDQSRQTNWDNSTLMLEILNLRRRSAELLGFESYADMSLASKMASSVEDVVLFLEDLAQKSLPQARSEFEDLSAFARSEEGEIELEPWDIMFYSERLKQQRFGFSKEELRAYFPLPKALDGLFNIVSQLFGIEVRKAETVDLYHPDVVCYEIYQDGKQQGGFYLDLYARENKRSGAWLASCSRGHEFVDGAAQLPVAFLVCNFTPPSEDRPCLLAPEEIRTLFHEFGHCLHYTLTRVNVGSVAGISNVPWDAVELPSQMLENWYWQVDIAPMISAHVETGEPVPTEWLKALHESQNFQSGMMMVRQLEFALFDFLLHRDFEPEVTVIEQVLKHVRERVSVILPPGYTRFANAFTHIFAGGYAAGYYSYKWAEVLASDAFAKFQSEGLLNAQIGNEFFSAFLCRGGTRDVNEMFKAFRGREPSVDALLELSGIAHA